MITTSLSSSFKRGSNTISRKKAMSCEEDTSAGSGGLQLGYDPGCVVYPALVRYGSNLSKPWGVPKAPGTITMAGRLVEGIVKEILISSLAAALACIDFRGVKFKNFGLPLGVSL